MALTQSWIFQTCRQWLHSMKKQPKCRYTTAPPTPEHWYLLRFLEAIRMPLPREWNGASSTISINGMFPTFPLTRQMWAENTRPMLFALTAKVEKAALVIFWKPVLATTFPPKCGRILATRSKLYPTTTTRNFLQKKF